MKITVGELKGIILEALASKVSAADVMDWLAQPTVNVHLTKLDRAFSTTSSGFTRRDTLDELLQQLRDRFHGQQLSSAAWHVLERVLPSTCRFLKKRI